LILPFAPSLKALFIPALGALGALFIGRIAQAAEVDAIDSRPPRTRPGDFALLVESGVAMPLTSPQSDLFKTGVAQTLKALWVVNENMNAGPSATSLALPTQAEHGQAGVAWTFGGTLRFRVFRNSPTKLFGTSPWVDADALYIRTGSIHRLGIAAAAGWSIPMGRARVFWLGPFVRYLHIMQEQRPGIDGRDAKILSLGLSLEVGLGRRGQAQ